MYIYTAYGLCIHSEIMLPELSPATGAADITVRLARKNGFENAETLEGIDYLVAETEAGKFWMLTGREIVVEPAPKTEAALVRLYLLGPILAVSLRQRKLLVLHASGSAIDDGMVAFLGNAGWGKSTLVEAFLKQGYPLVTDDVMAVRMEASQAYVLPSFPQVKLWPEAAGSLGYGEDDLQPLHSKSPKKIHRLSSGYIEKPLPLTCIYVLQGTPSPRHEVVPLTPQAAFLELVRHSRGMLIPRSPALETLHFQYCTRLVRDIPVRLLKRKRSLEALPELVALIENDLTQYHKEKEAQS